MSEEFYAQDRWPHTAVPRSGVFRRLYCKMTGGHKWRKFLWGGIDHPFDCDCCTKCRKFKGPLPLQRDTEVFPSLLR